MLTSAQIESPLKWQRHWRLPANESRSRNRSVIFPNEICWHDTHIQTAAPCDRQPFFSSFTNPSAYLQWADFLTGDSQTAGMRSSFIEGHTSEISFSTHQTQLETPNKRHTLTLQMSVIVASPCNLPSKTLSFSLPYIHLFLSYMCKALQLSITHEYLKISLFPTFMWVFRNSKSAATQSSSSSLWPAAQHLHLLLLEHDQKFSRSQKTSLPAAEKYDLGRRFNMSACTRHI